MSVEPTLLIIVVVIILLLAFFFFSNLLKGWLRAAFNVVTRDLPRNTVDAGKHGATAALDVAEDAANRFLELAHKSGEVLKDFLKLNPEITSEKTVIFGGSKGVLELAILETEVQVQHHFQARWLGSTKSLRVDAQYRAKIGYDLTKEFNVEVLGERVPTGILVKLPKPEVLSIEQTDIQLQENDGWWNRITPANRSQILQELHSAARSKVVELELLTAADTRTRAQLFDAFQHCSFIHGLPEGVKLIS